ncbi:MAG: flagellar brake domain-containing protein [Firmicutes bacterium]|nr:flagellar brake domain-containing protein [Bacillota bacterium]
MTDAKNLRVNMRIEVAREGEEEYYTSSIQDIKKDVILISIPYRARLPLSLWTGQKVNVRFMGDNEVFSFDSTVQGTISDGIPLYELAVPERLTRVQRRNHVRVPATLEIRLREATDGAASGGGFDEQGETIVKSINISAGGLKFLAEKKYPAGTVLMVRFSLPKDGGIVYIDARAKVVRCENVGDDDKGRYAVAVKFVKISPFHQDVIYSYVFQRMRELSRLRVAGKRGN